MSEPRNPASYNTPKQKILAPKDIDSLGQAVLTLAQEVWVLTDRTRMLEMVLQSHGIDATSEIDKLQPNKEQQAELDELGRAFVERITKALDPELD